MCNKQTRQITLQQDIARTSGWNRSVFPNATRFIFCALRWPHSLWRWQWNTQEHACAHERQNNRTATRLPLPFQATAHITDPDFKMFVTDRLITEMERELALYN